MEDFVHQYPLQLLGVPSQVTIEHDLALADVRARMYRLPTQLFGIDPLSIGGECREETNPEGLAREGREHARESVRNTSIRVENQLRCQLPAVL